MYQKFIPPTSEEIVASCLRNIQSSKNSIDELDRQIKKLEDGLVELKRRRRLKTASISGSKSSLKNVFKNQNIELIINFK